VAPECRAVDEFDVQKAKQRSQLDQFCNRAISTTSGFGPELLLKWQCFAK